MAKILKEVVGKEEPELVILGKQAIDGDYNQTGAQLLHDTKQSHNPPY